MKIPRKKKPVQKPNHRLGGRATAVGVGYEAQVAASIAVKMLGGDRSVVWDGISGAAIAAITMQDAEPVDDVVVTLRKAPKGKVFISAKHRSAAIALTGKSPAFAEVVTSFVRQFRRLAPEARQESRFMWAVPSSAGAGLTQDLRKVLEIFREDDSASFVDFARRRQARERKAMISLIAQAKLAWKSETKKAPADAELREFLRMVYVEVFDFGIGHGHERQAEETIRNLLAVEPRMSNRIWKRLQAHFGVANQRGLRSTTASLRQVLAAEGLKVKATPSFADDVELLRRLTATNLARLKDHTLLRFAKAEVHLERDEDLSAMVAAAKRGHLLVTGEPGCGKSGLIQPLAEALLREGIPVVLLLAEEIFGRDWKGAANLPALAHALDDVLANWPDGSMGVLITDALDAVRDVETQKLLRRLLEDVQRGESGWKVVASVREFDLKHGRELREAFAGDGVLGHCSADFVGVSHFQVTALGENEIDELVARVADIQPFVVSARTNVRAGGIHRSPFFLRLAAELLSDGVSPARLADWSSPAVLLRRFWQVRVQTDDGASYREVALQAICRRMVELRSMTVSTQETALGAPERDAALELRSRGILQSPALKYGSRIGDDYIRFAHHLLHDYAIARSLIPAASLRFAAFVVSERLLPIFYRQSFLFALEELWDGPDGPEGFWNAALQMEGIGDLHGITRILAPILAARRVDTPIDLEPLLKAVQASTDDNSPAEKALRHLASGLQDADAEAIRAGASAWCSFAAHLSPFLPSRPSLETPVVHILARLNSVSSNFDASQLRDLNTAARGLLAHHVGKEVSQGWRYAGSTAIETLCRTFAVVPEETESSFLSLLTPERLALFPHWDLFDLANQLSHLSSEGDSVVLRLFEAAFSAEPQPGEWEQFGGRMMGMQMQRSDNSNSVHYSLAGYYESRKGTNARLMTDIACVAWSAAVRRHGSSREGREMVIGQFRFRGVECDLVEDYGHIWGRSFEHEENRILSHFESLLDQWAAVGDSERLRIALDHILARNRTSQIWTLLLEAGAKHPTTLGQELESVLSESLFLIHPDYCYGGVELFAALHKAGDAAQRVRLENLILDLPRVARFFRDEPRDPVPSWLQHRRDKLLAALNESNLVLPAVQALRKVRAESGPLPANLKPEGMHVTSHTLSEEEMITERGVDLKDQTNAKLFKLREALKPFREQDGQKIDPKKIEENWEVIGRCQRALRRDREKHPEMAEELWDHLVGACESIVCRATWPATDARWKNVRRILLKASTDPSPQPSKEKDAGEDHWPTWGWPAPRLDAARGLLILVRRLGHADKAITAALLKLSRDKSHPLRFNMGDRLAALQAFAPELMWQLIDRFIRYEQRFSVLEAVLFSLDRLWGEPAEVKPRLYRIAERALKSAPDGNHIFETLAHTHLFHFLRTGDGESKAFIDRLIAECDSQRAGHALQAQLHPCRQGRWLTAGDGIKTVEREEVVRRRTWSFVKKLLTAAQQKLSQHRQRLVELHAVGRLESDEAKPIIAARDRSAQLVDWIATQLYFASGAFADKQNRDDDHLTEPQKLRFWHEAESLFDALASEIHPHTAHELVQALHHLLPCDPRRVFLTAAKAINASSSVGYQHESLAVGGVVKLIQRALADHREIFHNADRGDPDCLAAIAQGSRPIRRSRLG